MYVAVDKQIVISIKIQLIARNVINFVTFDLCIDPS